MSKRAHLLVQFCLIVIWVLILVADNPALVNSQSCPQPDYMWKNPLRKYWRANFGNVIVKIDSPLEVKALNVLDCFVLTLESVPSFRMRS